MVVTKSENKMNILKENWFRVSKDVECSVYPTNYVYDGIAVKSDDIFGFSADDLAFVYMDNTVEYWFYNNSYSRIGSKFFRMFIEDPKFLPFIAKKHFEMEKKCNSLNKKILSLDIKRCTNKSLINLYREFYYLITNFWVYTYTLSSMELEKPIVTEKVAEILKRKGKEDLLPLITTPTRPTKFKEEQIDFLNLKKKFNKKKIIEYLDKYYWMHYGTEGGVLNSEYLLKNIKSHNGDLEKELKKLSQTTYGTKTAEAKLNLNKYEQKVIKLARAVIYLKFMRKSILFKLTCDVRPVLLEIAARLKTSFKDSLYLHVDEVEKALENKLDFKSIEARK